MSIYRAICCARSSILARFEMFLGFGLGVLGGGVESLCETVSTRSVCLLRNSESEAIARTLPNQSDISDFVEKSFNSCWWISLASDGYLSLRQQSRRFLLTCKAGMIGFGR